MGNGPDGCPVLTEGLLGSVGSVLPLLMGIVVEGADGWPGIGSGTDNAPGVDAGACGIAGINDGPGCWLGAGNGIGNVSFAGTVAGNGTGNVPFSGTGAGG